MLGAQQLADLKHDLQAAQDAGITWKFIMTPEPIQNFGVLAASDRFEGYAAERTAILKFIHDNHISNVVFVSADFHGTTVNRLSYQELPGGPQIQTNTLEIVTGPIAYAIDRVDETAWTVDFGPGRSNVPRKAVFVLEQPSPRSQRASDQKPDRGGGNGE